LGMHTDTYHGEIAAEGEKEITTKTSKDQLKKKHTQTEKATNPFISNREQLPLFKFANRIHCAFTYTPTSILKSIQKNTQNSKTAKNSENSKRI